MADSIRDILKFTLQVDTKDAQKKVKELDAGFKRLTSAPKKMDKATKDAMASFRSELGHTTQDADALRKAVDNVAKGETYLGKVAAKQFKKIDQSLKEVTVERKKLLKMTTEHSKKMTGLEKHAAEIQEKLTRAQMDLTETAYSDEKELIEQEIAQLTKLANTQKAVMDKAEAVAAKSFNSATKEFKLKQQIVKQQISDSGIVGVLKASEEAATHAAEKLEATNKAALEAAEAYRKALNDYDGKQFGVDVAESIQEAAEGLGSKSATGFLKGVGKGAGSLLKPFGTALGKWAENKKADPGAGGGTKGVAKMIGDIGPLIQTLGKAGPLIATMSSAVMGLVKLFIDAHSQAKEINKDLLAGSNGAGFLTRQFGDTNRAAVDLDLTLKDLRDNALSFSINDSLGIAFKDHAAFLGTLGKEMGGLDKMGAAAKTANASVSDLAKHMVEVGVAYSRTFNVSLEEIGQLQGEMMSEMGMSVQGVTEQFGMLGKQAAESTMGANKFFNIIRSMSADMSLFNLRMEEAAHALTAVNKSMNAKNAQKYMQTLTNMYKDMGLEDRIKSVQIAGVGDTNSRLQKEQKGRNQALDLDAQGVGMSPGEMSGAIEKGMGAVEKLLAKYGEKAATLRDPALAAARNQKDLKHGGLVNTASALRNTGIMGAIEQMDAVSKKLNHGKTMDETDDEGRLATGKIMGVSEETMEQHGKFKSGLHIAKEEMALRKEKGQSTPGDVDALRKAGLDPEKATAEAIRKLSDSDVFASMAPDRQKALTEAAATVDWTKKTAEQTKSVQDRIDNLIAFMMGQFYNAVLGIWESVTDLPGFGDQEQKNAVKLAKALRDGKNPELAGAVAGAKPGEVGGKLAATVTANTSKFATMGVDGMQGRQVGDLNKVGAKLGGLGAVEAGKAAGLTDEQQRQIRMALTTQQRGSDKGERSTVGKDASNLGDVLAKAGLSSEQMTAFFKEALKGLSSADLVNLAPTLDSYSKPGTGTPGTPAAPGTPATPGAPTVSTAPPTKVEAATQVAVAATTDATEKAGEDTVNALRQKGVKLDKTQLKGDIGKTMEEAVYEGTSKALFEAALYKDLSPEELAKGVQSGAIGANGPGKDAAAQAKEGQVYKPIPPHADGGYVRTINGEGIASIAPGEHIVPKGGALAGGGGALNVNVNVSGGGYEDTRLLTSLIDKRVRQGVDEYRKLTRTGQ